MSSWKDVGESLAEMSIRSVYVLYCLYIPREFSPRTDFGYSVVLYWMDDISRKRPIPQNTCTLVKPKTVPVYHTYI